jgi:chemotaxis protein MotB
MLRSEAKLIETKIDFWPSLVDCLASALMLIALVTIMQRILAGDIEDAQVRQARDTLAQELKTTFGNAGLQDAVTLERSPNLLQIGFSDRVLFNTREYQLHKRGKEVLRLCAQSLVKRQDIRYDQIQVEGHTDDQPFPYRGSYPSNNWELSTARALEVLQELVRLKVPPKILSANGYGEQRPVASNSNDIGKSRNRRIELRIVFSTPGAATR